MMDIEPIFRYKAPNAEKLAAYGFLPDGEGVSKTVPILRGAFGMAVTVAPDGAVRFKVSGEGNGRGICARPCGQRPGRLRGRRAQGLRKGAGGHRGQMLRHRNSQGRADETDACLDQIRVLRRAGIPVGKLSRLRRVPPPGQPEVVCDHHDRGPRQARPSRPRKCGDHQI
jgi:hypothetical protein